MVEKYEANFEKLVFEKKLLSILKSFYSNQIIPFLFYFYLILICA